MPLYTFKCAACGNTETLFRRIADRDQTQTCTAYIEPEDLGEDPHDDDTCGWEMHRVIDAPYVAPDIGGYQSMVTGEWIASRSQHREHLTRHSLVEVGNEQIKPKTMAPPKQEDRKRLIAELVHSKRP